jgi:hypothetical protein
VKTQPPNEADWRRRHALNIASQLPEDPADGLVILDVAREIVVTLLQAGVPEPGKAAVVTLIRPRPI